MILLLMWPIRCAGVVPAAALGAAAGTTPATRNFDPAYCKRSAPREAVNDGNLADWPHAGVQSTRGQLESTRHGLSPRSESFMEQPAAPPFIMPD